MIEELENYCDKSDYNDIVLAVNAGLKKLDTYYTKTDDTTMYTIATGKLNIKIIIIFLNWWTILINPNFIVLDPRLKLGYYEDKKWKKSFIQYAKDLVLRIYNTNYAPAINEHLRGNEIDEDVDDKFLDHIYGKQKKVQQNEVDLYLTAPRADRKQDTLLWWKVYINDY